MVSFRQAAIEILREAKVPLHYKDITKRALEQNLIETTGSTPEATMYSIIITDIKLRGNNSPFKKEKEATFIFNKDYVEKKEDKRIEEAEEEQEEKEKISTQYIGKAGEHLVVSELLFRGYNASIMNVDEGLDIVATKEGKLYNIQVKTSNHNQFNQHASDIRISSFEKHNTNNTYYIFVLKENVTKFLIFPYSEMQKYIDKKIILSINKNTRYRVNITIRNEKIYLGNQSNEVSYYLNNWNSIK